MFKTAGIIGLAFVLAAPVAQAQDSAPVRVRGTIERVDGDNLTVKARNGAELNVTLAPNAMIVALVKASPSDIKTGSFIGVTGTPQPDGSQRAVEVHVFTEAMRGTGEGHYAWDLTPQSTMTNGNLEEYVTGTDGQTLMIKYKDGDKKIVLAPDTVVVVYTPGDRSDLKPGAKIFIGAAKKQPDGSLETPRINVGRDGLQPPM
jgi:hypothetical protein